jgi:hypothetical protein
VSETTSSVAGVCGDDDAEEDEDDSELEGSRGGIGMEWRCECVCVRCEYVGIATEDSPS